MSKKVKKIIALILTAAAVCTAFAACSKNSNGDKVSSAAVNVITREEGSGTRDAFVELMEIVDEQGNDATVPTAETTNSTSVMMSTVEGNPNAIGYVSLGSLSDTVKAVSLDGVAPSADTVKDGSYKLQRPFKIAYIEKNLSAPSKDFISYIMSTDGQAIIGQEGYISIASDTEYKASGMSGTISISGSTSVAPVMNVLADKYQQLNPNVKIEIQEPGSSAGLQSAIEGAVDIAMSSRELKDDELNVLKAETIALDGIAVIVNQQNEINALTSQQVKDIFTGTVTKWEEVR
ncbi:MAG: substrate-binding domain-containing protein [Eubacterium sp.]